MLLPCQLTPLFQGDLLYHSTYIYMYCTYLGLGGITEILTAFQKFQKGNRFN